jgi:hypothetical protein
MTPIKIGKGRASAIIKTFPPETKFSATHNRVLTQSGNYGFAETIYANKEPVFCIVVSDCYDYGAVYDVRGVTPENIEFYAR